MTEHYVRSWYIKGGIGKAWCTCGWYGERGTYKAVQAAKQDHYAAVGQKAVRSAENASEGHSDAEGSLWDD